MSDKELKTTRFVNIDDSKFTFHLGGQPIEVNAGEEKILTVYAAEHGAKHLVDLILQKKYGVKDTLHDTDLRRSVMASIIPDLAKEANVEPKTGEAFEKVVQEELERQKKVIDEILGAKKSDDEKDKRIAELEARLAKLESKKETKPKKVAK